MKTKAAYIVAPYKFEIMEKEVPALKPNDLLVEMKACGLCHSDIPAYTGTGRQGMSPLGYGAMIPMDYPCLIGHEPVGVVVDKGSEVKGFKEGDWVGGLLPGSFSSYAIGDPERLIKLPDGMRNRDICLMEPINCITNILRIAAPEFYDDVAVVGCGMMGLLCISGLKDRGLSHLIAIDLDDDRLALAKKYGATVTINPRTENLMEKIVDLTYGKGVDVSIELSGSLKGLQTAAKIARFAKVNDHKGRGKVLLSTLYGKEETWNPELGFDLMFRSPILISAHPFYAIDLRDNLQRTVNAYAAGVLPIDEMITHKYTLDNISAGFEMLAKPTKDYLKGMITF